MKRNKKRKIIIYRALLILGISFMLYPLFSRVYYDYRGTEEVVDFGESLDQLSSQGRTEKLALGYAYNRALLSNEVRSLADPFSNEEKEEGLSHYAELVEIKDKIGILTIPKLNMKFPIYAGTNEAVLQKGVGHMEGTSLPLGGLNSHSVLTAHRGLPKNKLFTDLNLMEIGDIFILETVAGTLAYEVREVQTIEPTDIQALVIEENKDKVTLLTCTPYMINSHRLLVIGERVALSREEEKDLQDIHWFRRFLSLSREYRWPLALIVLVLIIRGTNKRKKVQGESEKKN